MLNIGETRDGGENSEHAPYLSYYNNTLKKTLHVQITLLYKTHVSKKFRKFMRFSLIKHLLVSSSDFFFISFK